MSHGFMNRALKTCYLISLEAYLLLSGDWYVVSTGSLALGFSILVGFHCKKDKI